MTDVDMRWFSLHTTHAPQRLREHAAEIFDKTPVAMSRTDRLAAAGQVALRNATAHGVDRGAALDLLTADGLITLALLASAESSAASLGKTARALRLGANR